MALMQFLIASSISKTLRFVFLNNIKTYHVIFYRKNNWLEFYGSTMLSYFRKLIIKYL